MGNTMLVRAYSWLRTTSALIGQDGPVNFSKYSEMCQKHAHACTITVIRCDHHKSPRSKVEIILGIHLVISDWIVIPPTHWLGPPEFKNLESCQSKDMAAMEYQLYLPWLELAGWLLSIDCFQSALTKHQVRITDVGLNLPSPLSPPSEYFDFPLFFEREEV